MNIRHEWFPRREGAPVPQSPDWRLIFAWRTTGQACDPAGCRRTDGNAESGSEAFGTRDEALARASEHVAKWPHLEVHVRSPDGSACRVQDDDWESSGPTWAGSPGHYSVRLRQYLIDAPLGLDGHVQSADEPEPVLEFSTLSEARAWSWAFAKAHPGAYLWIYDPSGHAVFRGGTPCNADGYERTRGPWTALGDLLGFARWRLARRHHA